MKVLEKIKISVSIVSFNSGVYLLKCLDSLSKVKDEADFTIWVADNASYDGSIEKARKRFPNVHYLLNKQNIGFAKAQNLALRNIKTEYVLILNPDIILERGVLSKMLEFMEKNHNVGAASCEIVLADGKIDYTAHRGFPTPFASLLYFLGNESLYHLTSKDTNQVHEVDAISGAFFLTRKSVLEKTGLFDEKFFMYGEDIDLCLRIKKAGFKVSYIHGLKITHFKGISTGLKKHSKHLSSADMETRKKALDSFYESMKIFYRKHYQDSYPFFINWLVYLGINLKWILARRRLTV